MAWKKTVLKGVYGSVSGGKIHGHHTKERDPHSEKYGSPKDVSIRRSRHAANTVAQRTLALGG